MHGLYLLWFVQEKGLSPAVVAAILAAGDFVLLAVELPTGWFADRFGHRASLVLGSAVQVVGMLWCWLGEGVPGLVIASVLVALGDGFRSGATDALLYRTCLALDQEARFQQIEARAAAAETAVLAFLVLTGGAIVSVWGFAAGWIAEALFCAIGLVLACAMTEPPPAPDDPDDRVDPGARRGMPLRVAAIILPAALLGGAASIASFLVQTAIPDPVTVTWIVAALTVAEAAGAGLAHRLPADLRTQLGLVVAGATGCAIAIAAPAVSVAAVPLLAFLDGLVHPLRATAIQRLSGDGVRARLASLASACDMAVSSIALPLAGITAARRRNRRS